jgi:uncharacterized protein (DUF427 family)
VKAIWNREVVAESEDTIVVEGNHDFPVQLLRRECFRPSDETSWRPWKGADRK